MFINFGASWVFTRNSFRECKESSKKIWFKVSARKIDINSETSLISSNQFKVYLEELKIEFLRTFEVEKALSNHGFS